MKKNLTSKEKAEKRRGLKGGIITICIIVLMVPLIWYGRAYFAEESLVDYKTTVINGDSVSIILTEKTSSPNRNYSNANEHHNMQTDDSHYGYFLELYDSLENKSLDKIEFESPVWEIQNTPELRVFPNGIIWLVSASRDIVNDKPGFIMKFEIKNNKIINLNYVLDKKYRIRDLKDNWVIITDGNKIDGMVYDPVFGCTYLDLETEKIVVVEPYDG